MLSRWPEQVVGDRVLLRRASGHTDLGVLSAGWATPDIAAMLDDPLGSLETLGPEGYALAFIQNAEHRASAGIGIALAIVPRGGADAVGFLTLERDRAFDGWEVGYWTLPGERNRGYASDAVSAAAGCALSSGAETVWAEAYDRRSAAVLERAGFERCSAAAAPASRIGGRRYRRSALPVADRVG